MMVTEVAFERSRLCWARGPPFICAGQYSAFPSNLKFVLTSTWVFSFLSLKWPKLNNIYDHFANPIHRNGPKCWTVKSLQEQLKARGVTGISHQRKDVLLAMLEEQVLKNEANDLSESREDGESDDDDVAAATQYGDGAAERQDGNVTAGDGAVENVLDEQEEDEDAEGGEVLLL
mmetsp:Transcript_20228/g.50090  ORF Transcript_20228/g.50090 Transcript_20228/m.50090 type:complete len:175 (-) Transcript_20228:1761-2285(-)